MKSFLIAILLITQTLVLLGCNQPTLESVSAADVAAQIEAGNTPVILDVRTPEEYAEGHIPGAINISHSEVADRIGELEAYRKDLVVVHCKSGKRAAQAEAVLRENGFRQVADLTGHMLEWEAGGYPLERPGNTETALPGI